MKPYEPSLEPPEPTYDGDTGIRCKECNQPIFDGEWAGEDDRGRYICIDCAREEWARLTPEEQILSLHYDAVRLYRPTRILHR